MIYFFSATGNSKYVAERLGAAIGEETCPVEQAPAAITLREGEVMGLVAPTNWLGVALLAREFLMKTQLKASPGNYIFYVSTFGLLPGASGEDARRLLAAQGIRLNASFSIHMPENFTPIFSANCKKYIARTIERAETRIDRIISQVKSRKEGNHTCVRLPYFMRQLMSVLLSYEQQTKRFRVDEQKCIGCARCATKCPVQAITMTPNAHAQKPSDQHPVWTKDKCAICLGCLHRCPANAISYGASAGHGQYLHPKTTV
ncbi:MAG: EFR1 family ferrodoxin [Prevotella sp.]|nr:EFR1 family ferrodoxin [Prevotella sp.]